MQPSFVLAAILACVQFAIATPPSCLLAALGQQPNPADMKAVCDGLQSAMLANLTDVCHGGDLDSAYNTYSTTCSGVGVKVGKLQLEMVSAQAGSMWQGIPSELLPQF